MTPVLVRVALATTFQQHHYDIIIIIIIISTSNNVKRSDGAILKFRITFLLSIQKTQITVRHYRIHKKHP